MAYEITLSNVAEDVLFYADYFSYAVEAGINRATTLFPGIEISTLTDISTIINRPNSDVAIANFTRMFDTSYEHLWLDGLHLDPIRDAINGLSKYIEKDTTKDVNIFY